MRRQKSVPALSYFYRIVLPVIAAGLLLAIEAAAQPPSSPSDASAVKQGDELKYEDQAFKDIIRRFSDTYRFGPGDSLALRVKGQPEYSLEKAKVSPMGNIYHPLLGDIRVAGMTIEQLKKQLAADLSEYLIDPVVSIELLEAMSAKVGVIGEVRTPRIVVMTGPMTVLDAITESGGFTDLGKRSNVTLLRQTHDGYRMTVKVDVKRILEGKAGPEENLALQAGDTVIVHGNALKAVMPALSIMSGFTSLLSFISLGR